MRTHTLETILAASARALVAAMLALSACVAWAGKTFYTLNTANGLSGNDVRQVLQLPDGRMAVYTGKAVDIYDGQRFTSAAVAHRVD